MLTITPLNIRHIPPTLRYRTIQQTLFQETCNPRPDTYNNLDAFTKIQESFIAEMSKDTYLMFLMLLDDQIVGRINQTGIETDANQLVGDLGYRIGKAFIGKGYTTQSVQLLLDYVKKNNICELVYAGATIDNYISQIVLLKNQFQFSEKIYNIKGTFGPGEIYIEYERNIVK